MVDFSEALTKQELADDYILACQSRLTMDCDVEVELGDLIRVPARTCNAKIKTTEMLTSDIMAASFIMIFTNTFVFWYKTSRQCS